MLKFIVEIQETVRSQILVEADSADDALIGVYEFVDGIEELDRELDHVIWVADSNSKQIILECDLCKLNKRKVNNETIHHF